MSAPLQPWKALRDKITAADEAARLSSGSDVNNKERPHLVSQSGNPYPATPTMRLNGGWNGPIGAAHKVRTRMG